MKDKFPAGRLISIIMPAFNCEKYIGAAIESVQKQSYPDWELIVVDDCSSDRTPALIEKYAAQDPRIHLLKNAVNQGVGASRNRGVRHASGKWVAFLDSDDLWREDKLEKQIQQLEATPAARLLFTGSAFITESGTPMDYILHVPETISRRKLLRQNLVSCSSVLVYRECLLKYPMSESHEMHEDFAVWLHILEEEAFAYGIDEPLLIYRKSAASKSGNKLKAAKMNWNTYREAGLSFPARVYYMVWYTVKGILKYRNL
jgi:teichuronic acid biosynthesis glycosyltransferase TuaG